MIKTIFIAKDYSDSQSDLFYTPKLASLTYKDSNSDQLDEPISPMQLANIDYANYDFDDDEEDRRNSKLSLRMSIVSQNGFDISEVFRFRQKQMVPQKPMKRISFSQRITKLFGVPLVEDFQGDNLFQSFPPYLAFLILALSVILNSLMIPLFLTIPEITWARNSWRFLIQALILGPFVLYEKRTGNQEVQNCYKWSHAFNTNNIRTLFLASINISLSTTVFIVLSQYNYIANNFLLETMINFWLSVIRSINNEKRHGIEFWGQIMCVVGIGIIAYDSFSLSVDDVPPKVLTTYSQNDHFFMDPWERSILGILVPISVSIVSTQISLYTQELKYLYPPFLQLFLISIFTSLFLQIVGYFIFCTTVDGQHFEGWFGFVVDGAFTKFMYIAVVFNFGIFSTQVLIRELYEPIIPVFTSLMEPPFLAFFMDFLRLQYMPSSFAGLGYIMIIPGQFVIITGQYLLERQTRNSLKRVSTNQLKNKKNRPAKGPVPTLQLIEEEEPSPIRQKAK